MKPFRKLMNTAVLSLVFLLLVAGYALAARTLTLGSVTGTAAGTTVSLPISIDNPDGVGGIAFTIAYDPTFFTFAGLEQATSGWVISAPESFAAPEPVEDYPYYNPYKKEAPYAERSYTLAANATLFYQYNDIKDGISGLSVGRVLVSGASAVPLTGTVLFNARFTPKAGITNGTVYPVRILQSIINNPDAGYNSDTLIPVLVGVGEMDGDKYTTTDFPVIPATLVAGSITTTAATYKLGGRVTYGEGGSNAIGCTVTLHKETSPGVYVYRAQTTVGADGAYLFTGRSPGNFKLSIASLDPGYNDYTSATAIALAADKLDADVALALKTILPTRISSTVTAGNIAGLKAKVVDPSGKVMGYFAVNDTGYWETSLLPGLASGSYSWSLVYGTITTTGNPTTFDTSTLKSIWGTITGVPAGGAAVTVISSAGKLSKTVSVTYEDGTENYTINNLVPANDYIVSAVATGFPLAYYNGTTDVNAATSVNISTADATGIEFTFAPPTKNIAGWIKQLSGTSLDPVSGITVYGSEVNSFALFSTQTAADGTFNLTVDPGSYEVFVIKSNGKIFYFYNEDGTPTQVESGALLRTVTATSVAADTDNTNINITECDKTLSGYVTYLEDGDTLPMANVLIVVSNATQKAMGLTGVDGWYSVGGLCERETYTVDVKPLTGGYPVQTTSIVGGTNTNKNFSIDTGIVLSVNVTGIDTGGLGVSGAMIYLTDTETGSLVGGRIYFTDADGACSIHVTTDRAYTLEVTHPDYNGYKKDLEIGNIWEDKAEKVILEKGAYFTGTVTDNLTGKALPGATIIVTSVGATPVYTVTGSAGGYKVFGLDGTKTDYIIFAQRRGYERQGTPLPQQPTSSGAVANFALVPPTTYYTVTGTVQTNAPAPISGAIVLVTSDAKKFFGSTTTGVDGTYSVGKLIASTDYRIVVIPPGLPTQEHTGVTIPVPSPVDPSKSPDFTIAVGKDIGGTVTGSVAIPATTKVYVFLYKDTAYQGFQVAQPGGAFRFKGLPDGADYKLLVVAAGYTPQWYDGMASIANATPISITSGSKLDANVTLIKP